MMLLFWVKHSKILPYWIKRLRVKASINLNDGPFWRNLSAPFLLRWWKSPTLVTSQCPIWPPRPPSTSWLSWCYVLSWGGPEPVELMASSWARVSALSPQVEKWLQSQTTWSKWRGVRGGGRAAGGYEVWGYRWRRRDPSEEEEEEVDEGGGRGRLG